RMKPRRPVPAPALRQFSRRACRLVGGLLSVVLASLSAVTEAATVPGDYSSIQAAINAVVNGSLPGATEIAIQPGTYVATLRIAGTSRSMTLRAAGGPGTVVVDAAGRGTAIRIAQASGAIRIDGLKFTNGVGDSLNGGGFNLEDASATFVNCTFENNRTPF